MILVTGASGFVGRHLVAALIKKGIPVRCLIRSSSVSEKLLKSIEIAYGDVTDPDTLGPACDGVDGIIHLVAIIREKGNSSFEKVNIQGTRNIVAAAEAAGASRFIHMSALGARNDPAYRYVYSKWLAEEIVQQSALNWTIFRPSLIYGEGFGFFDRLLQSLKMFPPPFAPVPGGGRTRFQPIAVEDLVRCILLSLNNAAFSGRVCELGGPEHLSYAQMLDILTDTMGTARVKVPVPIPLMRIVAPLMGLIMKDPPVTPVELKQLDMDNITDPDTVEKQFGFKPRRLCDGLSYLARGV